MFPRGFAGSLIGNCPANKEKSTFTIAMINTFPKSAVAVNYPVKSARCEAINGCVHLNLTEGRKTIGGEKQSAECQNSAVMASAVQCSAVHCSALQCIAVQCSAVQCSAI